MPRSTGGFALSWQDLSSRSLFLARQENSCDLVQARPDRLPQLLQESM